MSVKRGTGVSEYWTTGAQKYRRAGAECVGGHKK